MTEARLYNKYIKEILPELKKELGLKNDYEVPRLLKIVLNVSINSKMKDSNLLDLAIDNLAKISGQKPVITLAKKSVSNFKIRKGMKLGAKVTLRKDKMYYFFDKLLNITLPRKRDFRGISKKSIDKLGNIVIGFRNQIPFPEMKDHSIEKLHGLEVIIHTTAKNREEGYALLKKFGFPFND